jgi:hypothetical protein
MRTALVAACVILLGLRASAYADSDVVVLGPIGSGDLAAVKTALGTVKGAKLGAAKIDAACAADATCLSTAGSEAGARRVLAVSVAGNKITLTLVDVGVKLTLGTRDVTITPKKLATELPATVATFIDNAITNKAKAVFDQGKQHYDLGEYTQALDNYKLAYRIKPLPAFQFNIAQCHRKLGQHKEAIAMYQAYLAGVPDASNKALIDSLIEEEKKAHADQQASETARERERLATERTKAAEARKAKEAEAAAQAEAAKAEQARIEAERARDKTYNRHPARKFMLVTGALGLAAGGAGAYFAVQARTNQRAFDDAGCGDATMLLGDAALAQCVRDRDAGERNAFVGNVLIASGAAVVLTSAIVFILDPGNVERPSSPRVSISPTSVSVGFAW